MLAGKFDRLKMLLANLDENNAKPDFILLCETWLSDLNCNLYQLNGYHLVDNHRTKKSNGGVAIYIKQGISFKLREDITIFEEGLFESLFVEFTINDKSTVVGEMYRLPGTSERHFLEKL